MSHQDVRSHPLLLSSRSRVLGIRVALVFIAVAFPLCQKMLRCASIGAGLLSLWAGLANAQGHYADNQADLVQDNERAAANFPDVDGVELLSPAFLDTKSVPAGFANGTSGPTDEATMGNVLTYAIDN